ncbi:LacI family DNA-binding transcriptional regulator [Amycolatopsis sp. WGS_07]|uniref:LacI family DNA-binding transcriptional regulator n=1 Tax=Amycolatopsis sp. WGS_07 TaxID=3076764 RepID=UPI0038738B98
MAGKRTRATIKDVARRAGVSPTTVSHAFSGNGTVAAGTADRVREAARELGYRPDTVARGLRSSRLGVLGLVVRPLDPQDTAFLEGVDYFLRFAGSAALAAVERGYGLMLVPDPTRADAPAVGLACDGFLITEPVENDPLITMLTRECVPFLGVGRDPARPASPDYLDLGTKRIVTDVLDHLAAAGGSRVAAVLGTDPNEWNLDAETAYLAWVRARGQEPLAVRRAEVAGEAGGREAGEELFGLASPPDAVYCQTGRHAAGVLAAARAKGLAVPGDVRIACGSDSDSEQTRSSVPPITSVDLRPVQLARVAVAVLVDRVEGIEQSPAPGPAEYELIVRGSTRG